MQFRSRVSALVCLIVLAVIALTPSQASARGGGCIDYIKNGWNIGVCSSDNGSRVSVDLYVNKRGSLGSECFIFRVLQDEYHGAVLDRTDGCYLGYHSSMSAAMWTNVSYRHYVSVNVNGGEPVWGTSPWSYK